MSDLPQHRLIRVRALIEVALPHLPALPPAQRADVYEGIADVAAGLDDGMSRTAAEIANHLREAELKQLQFRNLITAETPTESVFSKS